MPRNDALNNTERKLQLYKNLFKLTSLQILTAQKLNYLQVGFIN